MTRPTSPTELQALVTQQKQAFARAPYPVLEARLKSLRALRLAVASIRKNIVEALVGDFGSHDPSIGLIWELGGILGRLRYTSERLEKWMAPVERESDPTFVDSRSYVRYQPKGVVGNMAPWNFPVDITLGPLVDILAAGNRAIVKPSELAPRCAELVQSAIAEHFDPSEVAVVTGGEELAKAFAETPWDHLIYTGGIAVARQVMAAAAKNLTPVTLELGGKCPALILPDRVNADSISEILSIKSIKSGQVCITTDYVLVPKTQVESTVKLAQEAWTRMFPSFVDNPSATGIINERHYDRLLGYLDEARARGARIVPLGASEAPNRKSRKFPMTLVVDPPEDLRLMQEEIFGPILPIRSYNSIDDAIAHVNARPRPLALYIFTDSPKDADAVIARTLSGGVCINSVAVHGGVPSLPFGGIGSSGMGYHHGYEGFQTFSHARAVFQRGAANPWELMRPPWGPVLAGLAPMVVDQD